MKKLTAILLASAVALSAGMASAAEMIPAAKPAHSAMKQQHHKSHRIVVGGDA